MSRPAVCRCPSCEGHAPDDDDLDEDTVETRRRRQDALDDRARDDRDLDLDDDVYYRSGRGRR